MVQLDTCLHLLGEHSTNEEKILGLLGLCHFFKDSMTLPPKVVQSIFHALDFNYLQQLLVSKELNHVQYHSVACTILGTFAMFPELMDTEKMMQCVPHILSVVKNHQDKTLCQDIIDLVSRLASYQPMADALLSHPKNTYLIDALVSFDETFQSTFCTILESLIYRSSSSLKVTSFLTYLYERIPCPSVSLTSSSLLYCIQLLGTGFSHFKRNPTKDSEEVSSDSFDFETTLMPYLHLEKVSPRLLQSILITVTQGLTYFQETTSSSSPLSVMTTLGLSPNSIQLLIVRASCELQLHSLLDDDEQDEEDPMDVNEQKKGKTFPLAVCWNSSSSSEVSPWLIPCCCQLVELCLTEVMDRSWMEIAVNLKSTLLHLLHHFITTCQLRSPPSLPVLRCMVFLIGEIDLATLTSEQNDQKKWLQTCFQHWLTEHPTETYAPFLVPCIYHLGWETESKFALILKKLDGSDIDEEWDEENEEEEDEEDEEDYII